MPDSSEFSVVLSADVSNLLSSFDEAKSSAEETGQAMAESFGAGGEEIEAASERAAEALKELKEQSNEAIEKFTAMGEGLKGIAEMLGVGVLGTAIQKAVDEFIQLGTEVQRTATIMGVSNTEAHSWVDAAERSGIAANSFALASRTMNAQVLAGGKQLKEMGISLTETDGSMKNAGTLIEETIAKLESYTASVDRNALAQKTLGRGWIDLVANGNLLLANLEETRKEFANTEGAQNALVANTKELQRVQAEMEQTWKELVASAGPALITILKSIETVVIELAGAVRTVTIAFEGLISLAGTLPQIQEGLTQSYVPEGGGAGVDPTQFMSGLDKINAATDRFGQIKMQSDAEILANEAETQAKMVDIETNTHRVQIVGMNEVVRVHNETTAQMLANNQKLAEAPPAHMDKGGGRGGKGGGGADPMAGVDDQLISSQNQMDKLAQEYQKLGSESQMSAKASETSFADLRAKAVADYQVMMDAHKAFATAVQSGDAEAAKASEKDWHDAAQKFQTDWDQAKQKAQQDMQQIKSTADTIAGEVSGILNQAISGKLNWGQEFEKILSQMADKLIKHLSEQIALWVSHWAQVNAVHQAGATAGVAIDKEANAQAGASAAVTAAKGAYSSAAQIPYIGWIIAPIAAAAAFAGVEAFGSAEGGWDVPIGASPIAQLHPSEMVLPADIAGGMKQLIASGGGGGGGTSVTQNIHAIDSRSFLNIVDENHQGIAQAVAKARRNGGRFNTG